MFNRLKIPYKQHRLLFVFMAISLVIHLLFLTRFSLSLPDMNTGQHTIEMRLVQNSTKQTTAAVSQAEPKVKTTAKTTEHRKPEIADDAPAEVSAAIETDDAPVVSEAATAPADSITEHADQNSTQLATHNQAQTNSQEQTISDNNVAPHADNATSAPTGEMPPKPSPQGYQYVESEFAITRGADTSAVGSSRVIFNIDDNGTYLISSLTEAKGLASLFLGKLTQKSVGVVNENGLLPDFFSYQYGNDSAKEQTARFAWKEGVLHMRSAKGSKSEALSAGTQDLLSFMYQFMFSPPLENTQVIVTNGKHLRAYAYQFVGETVITTHIGNINTIHLIKTDDNQEKTELWLATDYQYLPVKIRKTEKNGEVIEQIITKVATVNR